MTQEQIHNLFKQAYNQNNWKQFLGETFANARLLTIPDTLLGIDTNVAKQALKLGYILLNENGIERKIAVYEVSLAKGIILERNRVGLRNLLRKYWKDIDAAFIVYHNSDTSTGSARKWRFTYVSELTGYDADGEFVKIKTEPKRYTYVLGEGESTRTAAERFSLIAKKANQATLEDVKEAFSVEKLSKAFFDEYKKHYDIFCDFMVSKPNIRQTIFNGDEKAIRDFNKKLLGRIVFLYFIQKKGWLGVPVASKWGEGDFNFLTQQFENFRNKDLFYLDFLSVLFFDTLNCKRKDDIFNFDNSQFITQNSSLIKIPYLNGGLFEEDDKKHRNLIFDAQLFKNLFDFFNQYNFTIYEDDPNDHTVAVDPEMLGHIFENLLEDNKDKGAFYTPKEIVHYMCQESLIEYLATWFEKKGYQVNAPIGKSQTELFPVNETRNQLEITETLNTDDNLSIDRVIIEKLLKKKLDNTDKDLVIKHANEFNEALDNVKICDPAIGSGAFPMGLLMEIYAAKQTLYHFEHGNMVCFPASDVKLNIIQNSIYGVDIEKGAVDIARLRFWLSLIVDEAEPKALPNLDYKIVVGNSLVNKLGDDIIDIDWTIKEGTQTDLFGNTNALECKKILEKISNEQKLFFDPKSDKKKLAADIRNLKIDLLIIQLQLMISTNGIEHQPTGNGKAIAKQTERYLQTMGWKSSIKDLQNLKNKPELPLHFFDWTLDFPEVMNEQVNNNVGFDIVIGNPPYVQMQKNGGYLSEQLQNQKYQTFERTGDLYCIFYEKGNSLLKEGGNMCLITSNKWMRAGYGESTRRYFAEKTNPILLIDFSGQKIFESATVDTNILLIQKSKNLGKTKSCVVKESWKESLSSYVSENFTFCNFNSSDSWVILNPIEQRIKQKIEKAGTPLKDWDIQINYGIKTGYNEAFIIDGKKKDELIAKDPKSAEIIRPILRGRDIKRYGYEFADLWLINTHNGIKEKGIKPINIDDYPAIKEHLDEHYNEIEKRADQGDTPYNLRNCAYIEDFYRPKIIYPNMTKFLPFVFDDKGFITNQKCFIITGQNIAFLTAFFNSSLFKYCFKDNFPELLGGTRELSKIFFDKILVKKIDKETNKAFLKLVSEIQTLKEKNESTLDLEKKIDNVIFDVYQLNESEKAEIGFIEIK